VFLSNSAGMKNIVLGTQPANDIHLGDCIDRRAVMPILTNV